MSLWNIWREIKLIKHLRAFVRFAHLLGLPQRDYENAVEFIGYNEAGLCFDLILSQLHEFEIPISEDYLKLTQFIARESGIDYSEIQYIEANISATGVSEEIAIAIREYVYLHIKL